MFLLSTRVYLAAGATLRKLSFVVFVAVDICALSFFLVQRVGRFNNFSVTLIFLCFTLILCEPGKIFIFRSICPYW